MQIRDLNPKGTTKIAKINKLLSEQFGMTISTGFPKKEKLEKVRSLAEQAIIKLKNTSKQFQLEPEYAKFLGVKDVIDTMIAEAMYAESPAYESMCNSLRQTVEELMDAGYTMEEASSECMNRYRMDNRFAYDDEHVLPIIIKAAKQYFESSCSEAVEEIVEEPQTDLNEFLLRELAKECGVELSEVGSYDKIEEKLGMFAEVSGKSRDAVVGFLNGLEEDAIANGIKMFGAKIKEANKFVDARRKAIQAGDDEFEVDGKKYSITGDTSDEKKNESMFDDIVNELLAEELEGTSVEEAEVVMAVRALADDIQDHVERLGRMVNEDLPAIADQMIHEFGAEKAAQFKDSADQVLQAALESSKQAKEGVNQLVGNITGQQSDMGLGDTSDLGDVDSGDMGIDDLAAEPEMDINEPAAAGPEDEPLGRAPVEV